MSQIRPQLLIELNDVKTATLDPDAVYSWRGQVWSLDVVGCVLCCEEDTSSTLVSTDDAGDESFICQAHGALVEIKYEMVKKYTVTIGGVVREGEEVVRDSMLFPASMSENETNDLINKLLDEADREENGVVVES